MVSETATEALQEAIDRAGGVYALGQRLGISGQAISQWLRNGLPLDRVLQVERATGVPCWRLAPDYYPPERFCDSAKAEA